MTALQNLAVSQRCADELKGEEDSMISRTSFIGALISRFTFMSLLSSLQAQGVATARISGTLTDDSGAVLVGVTVQAKNVEMGSSRSRVTDSGGRFAIGDLPIGSCDVRASRPGFDPVVHSAIMLTVGARPGDRLHSEDRPGAPGARIRAVASSLMKSLGNIMRAIATNGDGAARGDQTSIV